MVLSWHAVANVAHLNSLTKLDKEMMASRHANTICVRRAFYGWVAVVEREEMIETTSPPPEDEMLTEEDENSTHNI